MKMAIASSFSPTPMVPAALSPITMMVLSLTLRPLGTMVSIPFSTLQVMDMGGVGTAEVTVTVGTPVTNHCTVNPCQNGGTCEEIPGDYLCSCVFGWGGKDCGINTDDCYPEPCLNGGTCTDLLGSYECSCPVGWEGTNCDTVSQVETYIVRKKRVRRKKTNKMVVMRKECKD